MSVKLKTYGDIADEIGCTRTQLQSFVKRCQRKDPRRFRPDGQMLSGKALTHGFNKESAKAIKSAWKKEGPGRKL